MGKSYLKIIDTKLGIETNVNFNSEIGSSLANIDKALMNFKNKDSLAMNLTQMGYVLPKEFDFKIEQDGKSFNVLYGDNIVINYFCEKFSNHNFKPTKDWPLTSFKKKSLHTINNKEFCKYLLGQLDHRFESYLIKTIEMYQESFEYENSNGLDWYARNFYKEFNRYAIVRTFSEIVNNYNLNYGKSINVLTPSILNKQKDPRIDMFKTNFDVFYLAEKRKTKPSLQKVKHQYIERPVLTFFDDPELTGLKLLDVWTLEQLEEFLPHDDLEELNDQIRDGRKR